MLGRLSLVIAYAACIAVGLMITTAKGKTLSCDNVLRDGDPAYTRCVSALITNLQQVGSNSIACTKDCRQRFNAAFECGLGSVSLQRRSIWSKCYIWPPTST